MNNRPTPETDGLWHTLNTGNRQPSWWVVAEKMRDHARKLERERDEARMKLAKITEAAAAVVDRWEQPVWKDVEPTAVVIYKLRDALEREAE